MELDHAQIRIAQLESHIASLESGYNEVHRDMVKFRALSEERLKEINRLLEVNEETVKAATRMANELEGAWEASLTKHRKNLPALLWDEFEADLNAARVPRVG